MAKQPDENPQTDATSLQVVKLSLEVTKAYGQLHLEAVEKIDTPAIKEQLLHSVPNIVRAVNGMHKVTSEQDAQVEKEIRDNKNNGNENAKQDCLMRNNISNQKSNNKTVFHLANAAIGVATMADANEKKRSKISKQSHGEVDPEDEESNKQFTQGFDILHTALSSIVINVVKQQIKNTKVIETVLNQDKAIKENKEAQTVLSEITANKVSTYNVEI